MERGKQFLFILFLAVLLAGCGWKNLDSKKEETLEFTVGIRAAEQRGIQRTGQKAGGYGRRDLFFHRASGTADRGGTKRRRFLSLPGSEDSQPRSAGSL